MLPGGGGEGHAPPPQPSLHYEAPWVDATWNPHARFAVYERVDDAAEDETLYDLWVDAMDANSGGPGGPPGPLGLAIA